jgi:hypothetical protein
MTNTISAYQQTEAVLEQTWDSGLNSASFIDSSAFVYARATVSLAIPPVALVSPLTSPHLADTTSRLSQAPVTIADARTALKARYKAMPNTEWFKAAHEDRSLGEAVKIT